MRCTVGQVRCGRRRWSDRAADAARPASPPESAPAATHPYSPRVRGLRLSPSRYALLCRVALVALIGIVVTGGAVRLTGSGLGCSDWPTCEQDRLVAPLEFHPMVEFVNRAGDRPRVRAGHRARCSVRWPAGRAGATSSGWRSGWWPASWRRSCWGRHWSSPTSTPASRSATSCSRRCSWGMRSCWRTGPGGATSTPSRRSPRARPRRRVCRPGPGRRGSSGG